jgi:hypothetical protein
MSEALASGDTKAICDAMVSIAYHDEDWHWAQQQFLELLSASDTQVRGLAATCLGHLARIHGMLDRDRVETELRKYLEDAAIGGRASDALDDIGMFLR